MFTEVVPVPREGGEVIWHVLVTEPYMFRVEFACTSATAAATLRAALDNVTAMIVEPTE
jgi:hypothetical protein